ncbi:MAG TPA: winged helix DNA-binding domain-containing protein [Thermoanaerobaculia bacterium]|nr:winged helix DNA-binding domain-containing protein [Thermoanaerobaculia bacterium]
MAVARVRNQLLDAPAALPREVVSHLVCVQAQDYLGALWAVGLRTRSASEADVERALANREIVRTFPLRGTLHFVAAEDVHWILDFLAPRVLRSRGPRQMRVHGLDAALLRRCRAVASRVLRGENALTREELYREWRVPAEQGLQLIWRFSHEKLMCFGARRGKQQTFVLLDEWIPSSRTIAPADPLQELVRRYFASHGPATPADFAWWAGVTPAEARSAHVEIPPSQARDVVRLLPPYDEFIAAYTDYKSKGDAVIVSRGAVVGTWKRTLTRSGVAVHVSPARALRAGEQRALDREIARYAGFVTP